MSLSEYAYPSARVGGMKSRLTDPFEVKALLEAGTFEDALSLLKNTPYGKGLSKIQSPTPIEVEKVLVKELIRDFQKILKSVQGPTREFLLAYARRFEIAALKALLAQKLTRSLGTEVSLAVPHGILDEATIERLLQAETAEEFVEHLQGTEYYPLLTRALRESEAEETPSLLPYFLALDRYYYEQLWEKMEGLKGRDRESARGIIGPEIDFTNFAILLRLRGTEEAEAWRCLLPVRYKLNEKTLRLAFNLEKLTELFTQIPDPRYRELIFQGMKEYEKTGSSASFEILLRKRLFQESLRVFYGDRFTIALLIAYLTLKETEVRNFTAILNGKEAGLPAEEIEALVVLP
jgi:V/A-type H+-transporting ATPase subunit C